MELCRIIMLVSEIGLERRWVLSSGGFDRTFTESLPHSKTDFSDSGGGSVTVENIKDRGTNGLLFEDWGGRSGGQWGDLLGGSYGQGSCQGGIDGQRQCQHKRYDSN